MIRLSVICAMVSASVLAQTPAPDARYTTRASDCRYEAPQGAVESIQPKISEISAAGYVAQRMASFVGDVAFTNGGEITVCTEYGGVEIADSDDERVHVQVRWDAFGEGATDPAGAARKVIDETPVRVHITTIGGKLAVRVWHPTLGFSAGGQPAWVSVRILVPDRGAFNVTTEAFHGIISIRRLTLSRLVVSGRVGEKLKGIDGFHDGIQLFDVTLAGDVDITNPMTALGAPVLARLRASSNSRINVQTGGNIDIAIQPHPALGVRAFAASDGQTARVNIDRAVPGTAAAKLHKAEAQGESPSFDATAVRVTVRAISGLGHVEIASVPNAPLRPPER